MPPAPARARGSSSTSGTREQVRVHASTVLMLGPTGTYASGPLYLLPPEYAYFDLPSSSSFSLALRRLLLSRHQSGLRSCSCSLLLLLLLLPLSPFPPACHFETAILLFSVWINRSNPIVDPSPSFWAVALLVSAVRVALRVHDPLLFGFIFSSFLIGSIIEYYSSP